MHWTIRSITLISRFVTRAVDRRTAHFPRLPRRMTAGQPTSPGILAPLLVTSGRPCRRHRLARPLPQTLQRRKCYYFVAVRMHARPLSPTSCTWRGYPAETATSPMDLRVISATASSSTKSSGVPSWVSTRPAVLLQNAGLSPVCIISLGHLR